MNFAPNIRPDFSVPPPTMSFVNNGMGPRPNLATQNQFQLFNNNYRPSPPFNPKPPFPPFNFNPATRLSHAKVSSNVGHHGPRGLNFSPTGSNYSGRGGGGRHPQTHCMQGRQQIRYDDLFGTASNIVNNQNLLQSNSQQQQQQMFQQAQTPTQNGRGRKDFRPGRGMHRGGQRSGQHHDRNFRHQSGNNRNFDPGSQGHPKKKKERVDKRDLPENNAFSCDICDRGFKTEEKFKEHVDGHVKCSYKDCPYVAAPKLVQIHINTQHRAGLAKKIWSLESEEDVKKWREDRKRNYPTAANIQKKKELRAERLKRGEVLETKDFSKMKGGGGRDLGRGRGRHKGRYNRGRHRRYGRFEQDARDSKIGDDATVAADDEDDDDGPPEVKKIRRSSCQENEGSVSVDVEQQPETVEVPDDSENSQGKGKEIGQISSLSLLTGYGSSSSGEDDSDNEEDAIPLPKDSLEKASNSETSKTGNSDKSILFQPFTLAEEGKSLTSLGSKELPPSASKNQNSSSQSEDSSEDSPVAYERDPFNLTTSGQESSVTLDRTTNPKNSQGSVDRSSRSLSQSMAEESEDTNVLQRVVKKNLNVSSIDNGDCVKQDDNEYFNDFPIDDSEIFPHFEHSCEKLPAPKSKSAACSDSPDSTNHLHGRTDRKLERSRSGPVSEGWDKERRGRRGEKNGGKRRQEEPRPKAKSYTLLEKLLAPQIRQERNKILQCIYYIVKHKFFD